jgi:murein DD-endopeptidase MepM/ murein hydrolase activator NlpD
VKRFSLAAVVLALCLLVTASLLAGTLDLTGSFEQGGLVRGTTVPGATLTLDGHPLLVSPEGNFLFGFGRDAPEAALLAVHWPDGSSEERPLTIAKRTYDIQRIDGLPQETVTPDPKLLERIKREADNIRALRAIPSADTDAFGKLIWPAVGPISGVYGSQRILNGEPRAPHGGLDIAAPRGSPIVAAAAGTVTMAEHDLFFTGGTVIIDHGYGLASTYQHMDSVAVKVGQRVAAGESIGTVGATGRVTGPHLHLGLNWYEVRLDPALALGPMPTAGR